MKLQKWNKHIANFFHWYISFCAISLQMKNQYSMNFLFPLNSTKNKFFYWSLDFGFFRGAFQNNMWLLKECLFTSK